MTSPMNGTGELERRITRGLHDHSRLAPDSDGWEAILDRIEQRGRARHRRRAAATGLVMVGMVGTLVVLTGDDDTRVSTTPATPATPAADTAGAAGSPGQVVADGALPRLIVDVPGFVVTRAAQEADGRAPDIGPLMVYTTPGDGILGVGPVLFARLVPAGAAYGIGDGPDVQAVDIDGRPGRLLAMGGTVTSLGWAREDGSLVHLIANGVPGDDLLAAGQALEVAFALGQDPPTRLPGGMALSRTTRPEGSESDRTDRTEVSYRSGSRLVELRLTTGGDYEHDRLVLDRLASSTSWRTASVDGRAANLATYQESADVAEQARTLLWVVDNGVVAELTSYGLSEAELEAAADSIIEIDEAQWGELVARFEIAPADPGRPDEAAPEDATAGFMAEICGLRARWLAAQEVGGGERGAALVADLELLLEKGRAAGLGQTGDILVVAERLVEAMNAGDAAAVSSIPEGGACS